MFDEHARSLFSDFPEFEGLLRDNTTRALSQAYLAVVEHRLNGSVSDLEQLANVQALLRRLANTLMFHVILDDERDTAERQAAGFVAAEAIALMADYLAVATEVDNNDAASTVRSLERFARFESSLLYLFAEYDASAAGVIGPDKSVSADNAPLVDLAAQWCFEHLRRLCRLSLHPAMDTDFDFAFSNSDKLDPLQLEADTLAQLYVELGRAVHEFCMWLAGTDDDGRAGATERLQRLMGVLSDDDRCDRLRPRSSEPPNPKCLLTQSRVCAK